MKTVGRWSQTVTVSVHINYTPTCVCTHAHRQTDTHTHTHTHIHTWNCDQHRYRLFNMHKVWYIHAITVPIQLCKGMYSFYAILLCLYTCFQFWTEKAMVTEFMPLTIFAQSRKTEKHNQNMTRKKQPTKHEAAQQDKINFPAHTKRHRQNTEGMNATPQNDCLL